MNDVRIKLLFVDYFFLSLDSSHFLSFIYTLSTSSFSSFSLWRSNLTPNVLFRLILFQYFPFLSLSLLLLLTPFLYFFSVYFILSLPSNYLPCTLSVIFIFFVSHFLSFLFHSFYLSFLLFHLTSARSLSLSPLL